MGKNPLQPTVKSFLPFQAIVPFLRGGGRAVTLEAPDPGRAQPALLDPATSPCSASSSPSRPSTGGTEIQFGTSITTGGFQRRLGQHRPDHRVPQRGRGRPARRERVKNLSVFERFLIVYQELVKGESSGLTQLQVDQVNQNVQEARNTLISSQTNYRNDLDQFKIQLGMPPDVPLIIDRTRTRRLQADLRGDRPVVARAPSASWASSTTIVARLPDLEDLVLDGRSCQDVFSDEDGSSLEDLLLTAERIAMENRLDLMNARAQLYDTWRQIRVAANALKGVLNVKVTNQILTPPTTNNPFGFVSQARQFSLVLNAELPLVRVAERNNFVNDLINYQRQRRTLQNTEDLLKFQLRSEIRQMQLLYTQFQVAERNLILSVRTKDQSFEQIVAPPQPNATSQGAVQTNNLIQAQGNVISQENNLVTALVSVISSIVSKSTAISASCLLTNGRPSMRFSLQTGPDGGADAAIGRDGRPAVAQPGEPGGRRSRALKAIGLLAVVAGVAAAVIVGVGVPGVKRSVGGLFASTKADVITTVVRPGKLSVIVKEKGNLESAANKDVLCEVEGGTTIIMIKPEGTPVKQGDVVAELDSAALRDSLINQKITTQQAEASLQAGQAGPRGRRVRRQGVRRGHLQAGQGHLSRARSPWPSPTSSGPSTGSTGRPR